MFKDMDTSDKTNNKKYAMPIIGMKSLQDELVKNI